MALSGSTYVSFARHRLVFEWNVATQSIPNNNSIITGKLFLQSMDVYGAMYAPVQNAGSMTINGERRTWTNSSDLQANQKKLLFAGNWTIPHNSDGTKSFSFSSTYNINVTFNGVFYGNYTVSGNGTLNTIPRTSGVSITANNIKFNDSTTINISRKSSSFTHTITFKWYNLTITIANKTSSTSINYKADIQLSHSIPNGTSGWGTIICDTYSGNTKIGSTSTKLTINTQNNSDFQPDVAQIVIKELNNSVTTSIGAKYLQNKSSFSVQGICSTSYSATVARTELKFGKSTYYNNPMTDFGTTEYGTLPVVFTVWDSRGYSASKSTSIVVERYDNPRVDSFSVKRRDNQQEIVDITWKGTTFPVGVDNTMGYKLEYNSEKNKTWVSISSNTSATQSAWTGTTTKDGMAIDQTYNYRLTIYDEMMNAVSSQVVPVATVPMSWGSTGSAVGKVFEEGKETFQVAGDMSINGVKLRDIFYPVGSIYQSTDSTNPSQFIGGTWERYAKGRNLIGVDDSGGKGIFGNSNYNGGSRNPLTSHDHQLKMILNGAANKNNTIRYGIKYSGHATNPDYQETWRVGDLARIPSTSDALPSGQTGAVAKTEGQNAEALNYQEFTTVYMFRRIG